MKILYIYFNYKSYMNNEDILSFLIKKCHFYNTKLNKNCVFLGFNPFKISKSSLIVFDSENNSSDVYEMVRNFIIQDNQNSNFMKNNIKSIFFEEKIIDENTKSDTFFIIKFVEKSCRAIHIVEKTKKRICDFFNEIFNVSLNENNNIFEIYYMNNKPFSVNNITSCSNNNTFKIFFVPIVVKLPNQISCLNVYKKKISLLESKKYKIFGRKSYGLGFFYH